MYGTGFFPTEEHEFYTVERDELYLTGTSEVAARLDACRRDPVQGRASAFATRASRRVSAGRPAATGRTRRGSSGCISSTRSSSSRSLTRTIRGTSSQAIRANQETHPAGSRDPVSGARDVRGRPRCVGREEGRPRGVAAGGRRDTWRSRRRRTRPTTRPGGCSVRFRDGSDDAAGAHAERHRLRGRPHDRRPAREPPTGRRQRLDPRGPAALHGLRGDHPPH